MNIYTKISCTAERMVEMFPLEGELARCLARIPAMTPTGPFLAGGALRRTAIKKTLDSDFDVFFRDEAQFEAFVADMKERGAFVKNSNEHNVTLVLPAKAPKPIADDEFTKAEPEVVVQAIRIAFYPTIEAVLDSFDFTICQLGFDGDHYCFGAMTLWDLARMRLVPHRVTYSTASMRRILKYTSQGFTLCAGAASEFLKLVVQNPASIQADIPYID